MPEKFESFGFVAHCVDGDSIPDILAAFEEARTIKHRPYVMVCDTRIFKGVTCLQQALPTAHYVAKASADWEAGIAEMEAKLARQIEART